MKNGLYMMVLCGLMMILLLPNVFLVFVKSDLFVINENRNRLSFPKTEEFFTEGFETVNSWYNDNFGLRDLYIRIQHQIDYSCFGYSKELFISHVDDKEYLHYRGVVAIEQVHNEEIGEDVQKSIVVEYNKVRERLEETGVAFRFIIPPQKNEILDVAGQMPVVRPKYNMYYKMQDLFLESELSGNYVVVTDVLKKNNKIAPVFYYTDFHWNGWGAATGFGQVINSLEEELGYATRYDVSRLEISEFKPDRNSGQLSSLSVLFYRIPYETKVKMPNEFFCEEIKDERYPAYRVWENKNDNTEFDFDVLFIGDSYTEFMIGSNCGIMELFPRAYFCHWNDSLGIMNNIPDNVGAVVIERIESAYPQMTSNLQGLW